MKMLLYLALGACALPSLSQPLPVPSQQNKATPEEAIETSVRDFARDANRGSFSPDQFRVADARVGYYGAQVWLRDYAKNKPFEIEVWKIEPLKLENQSARVRVTYQLNPSDFTASIVRQEIVDLKRGPAQSSNPKTGVKMPIWQIVPPATRPSEPTAKTAETTDWFAYLSWKLAQKPLVPADYAPQQSLKNLEALAKATLQFSQDYDSIAAAPEYIEEALEPYISDYAIFLLPNSYERYAFNANLSGRFIDINPGIPDVPLANAVAQPEKVILFYEGRGEQLNFRYDGKAAVSFADGHVALVSPDEAKNLRWIP